MYLLLKDNFKIIFTFFCRSWGSWGMKSVDANTVFIWINR